MVWLLAALPGWRDRTRLGLVALVSALVPAAAYTAVVAAGGGIAEMVMQLISPTPVLGSDLVDTLQAPEVFRPVLAGIAALLALAWLGGHAAVRLTAQVFLGAVVLGVVSDGDLEIEATWAIVLFWLVIARAAVELITRRRIDWTALVLVGAGWMASLSYGIATPNLVAGSSALYLLHRAFDIPVSIPGRREVALATTAIVVLALMVLPMSASARTDMVYRDRPEPQLTADLGLIHPALRGVRGTPVTAQYLRELVGCVEDHPASNVAVVPDNAIIYPMLRLHNPLAIDWAIPTEITNSEDRLLASARAADREGDYLVLLQTRDARDLPRIDELSRDPGGAFRDPAFGERLFASFSGEPVECGVFIGFWSPAD
jgi:hypothetical protein